MHVASKIFVSILFKKFSSEIEYAKWFVEYKKGSLEQKKETMMTVLVKERVYRVKFVSTNEVKFVIISTNKFSKKISLYT